MSKNLSSPTAPLLGQRLSTSRTRAARSSIGSPAPTWAGLRTFAPDRNPVFGWDDAAEGFLWMVGQGGCGIVTAPAAGAVAASLVAGEQLPTEVADRGLTAEQLAPRR